jgi:hypothetical protein
MHRTLLLATSGVEWNGQGGLLFEENYWFCQPRSSSEILGWHEHEASQRTRLKFEPASRNQTSPTIWTHLRFGPKLLDKASTDQKVPSFFKNTTHHNTPSTPPWSYRRSSWHEATEARSFPACQFSSIFSYCSLLSHLSNRHTHKATRTHYKKVMEQVSPQ